ncbi:MAG: hypothetical protein HQM10_08440 [Candidatus Riflebacteria bacterium]|nr:hypothetical protein [Candidatus Riflebacteria bacterium]
MEMLVIVCSSTLQDMMNDFLEKSGITSYTRVPEVIGAGLCGGKRLNDEIWPGVNTLYLIALQPDKAAGIKNWAREYRREEIREGLKVFSLNVQEII